MTSDVVDQAVQGLYWQGLRYHALLESVPRRPGLYAIHLQPPEALDFFDWDVPCERRPLYVGKAERSLHHRDVTDHFSTGKTGWSTLRRSLAVILQHELSLEPVRRNDAQTVKPTHFGLANPGEEALSRWMHENLSMSWWVSPQNEDLGKVEQRVLALLDPPANLNKVPQPSKRIMQLRMEFADRVRAQNGIEIPRGRSKARGVTQ
ncbi:hypothetical protein H5399_09085 [Tessaracoccus sp. MC1627]|uniref:GIY-YIG nuclease family protein n=1 Tax=Tessaracoccus sp. MC1627 TaxID=2760312 RepID=UPI0016018E7E|nr:hypothetical protein [Tessaracoccus sp. MC1627]MBB1512756.1 hypothetical protein [Tessaracoccus sp. MC1627]